MAAKVSYAFWIIVAAVTMAAVFFPSADAVKYGMCQSECMNIKPNCSAWCKRIGYPKGGECIYPHYNHCCCWEILPVGQSNTTSGLSYDELHM
ncbi:hypothetical protein QOZ80_9AG0691150 [Eleusine coracana subsp. coracana]|nr:hypothetical protein QOZ80_9AG0691150 [Eleusine coracana subsp. coracana]